MSLNVYVKKEEIPKELELVDYNDVFFINVYLKNDEVTNKILKEIDKSKYASKYTFTGRTPEMGNLNKECLSTGCKTILNAYYCYNEPYCFDFIECGYNVQELIYLLKDGNIYIKYPTFSYSSENHSCDIVYKGKKYTDFNEFKIDIIMDLGGDFNDYEFNE